MATHPALRNTGPTTKYPCPVCARNVTGRGVSYLCNSCSGWVHSKCSGLQNSAEYRQIKDRVFSSCNSPPTLPKLQPPPIPTQAVDGNSFTIMKFNANGISNKLTELGEFLKQHNVTVAVIQESRLSSNSKHPELHRSVSGEEKDRIKATRKKEMFSHEWLSNKNMSFSENTGVWWLIYMEGEGMYCLLCKKYGARNLQNNTEQFATVGSA